MTIFRIDAEALVTAGRKAAEEDEELARLIREAEANLKSFKKWADEMEAKRKFALRAIPPLKNTVRDLYREIDKKIQDKSTEPAKKKVLKDLLQQANKMWIQLDTLLKAIR